MHRMPWYLAFAGVLLWGCGDGSDWSGKWKGELECSGYTSSQGPVQGTLQLEGEFDEDGHLLLEAGNKKIPQKEQGQVDQWVPQGGGTAKRVLETFRDDGDHRVYVFEERYDSSNLDGYEVVTVQDELDLELDGDVIHAKVEHALQQKGTGPFAAMYEEQFSCKGDLKRQGD
ncbi:MAG TPA: hypothetical protein VKY51_02535 [Fredinandcohnia sp.]|nr:hypothetical protein [Fredinandcohnia sp.]